MTSRDLGPFGIEGALSVDVTLTLTASEAGDGFGFTYDFSDHGVVPPRLAPSFRPWRCWSWVSLGLAGYRTARGIATVAAWEGRDGKAPFRLREPDFMMTWLEAAGGGKRSPPTGVQRPAGRKGAMK
jgi:hypothetical protein